MPMMDTANSLPPWDTTPPIVLGRLHSGQQGEGWRCQDPPTVYIRTYIGRACVRAWTPTLIRPIGLVGEG